MSRSISTDEMVKELWARHKILDLLVRWCRGVNRCDVDIIRETYWEDGIDDHGEFFHGSGADFAKWTVELQLNGFHGSNHYITNHLVEFDPSNDNIAYGETYILLSMRSDTFVLTTMARLLDRFECRNGEWRIAHHHAVADWRKSDPIGEKLNGPDLPVGLRTRSDPSYKLFNRER